MAFDKKDTFALGNTMKNLDFSDAVKNIQCPTLILCGEKDGANMKSAALFGAKHSRRKTKNLENAGHVVNEETQSFSGDIERILFAKPLMAINPGLRLHATQSQA